MGPHQVSYVDVAQRIRLEILGADDIFFPTIGAKYNGPLKALNGYIADVTYDSTKDVVQAALPNGA